MEKILKKIVYIALTMIMVCGCFSTVTFSSNAETTKLVWETLKVDQEEFPSNEELFAGYVENVLYGDLYEGSTLFGSVGENRLQKEEKILYRLMKERVKQIADGEVTSSEMTFTECFTWTAKELGVTKIDGNNAKNLLDAQFAKLDVEAVISYLLMDCPYEMYWYDKTAESPYGYGGSYTSNSLSMTMAFQMSVAAEYASESGNVYEVNAKLPSSVAAAKNKAQSIVDKNKGKSDYEKLCAYKEEICELVSYNYDVANEGDDAPYGNPFQLIWVFDEDPNTKVVCEGYVKAFQYLCDLSGLDCYTVTGMLTAGTGAGRHMWNIVPLEGKNYLVDLTNCDSGTIGYPDLLFLSGTEGTVAQGYNFNLGYMVSYIYEREDFLLLGDEILTLATEKYTPKGAITPEEPTPDIPTIPVTEEFSDVKENDWFLTAVQYVFDNGIMGGSKGVFNPSGNITREQVVATLFNMEEDKTVTDYTAVNVLKDLKAGQWYTDAVCWAYNVGVAQGNSTTKMFSIGKPITREQLAVMLYNYSVVKGYDVSANADYSGLKGANEVSDYATSYMSWAYGMGLIGGNGNLNPKGNTTRAQMASMMKSFCEKNNL